MGNSETVPATYNLESVIAGMRALLANAISCRLFQLRTAKLGPRKSRRAVGAERSGPTS